MTDPLVLSVSGVGVTKSWSKAVPARRTVLWWGAAAALLAASVALGSAAAADLGWVGVPGVFTAHTCRTDVGRGGPSTRCSGVFVSVDGRLVDRGAHFGWAGAAAGARTRVRSIPVGGYLRPDPGAAAFLTACTVVVAALGAACGFAGRPRGR